MTQPILRTDPQRAAFIERLYEISLPLSVVVKPYQETRRLAQNSKLHAMLGDIAKQKQWHGEWLDIDSWKRLITAAWMRATGQRIKLVPALDGEGVDVLYRHTHTMSVKEMASLIEYLEAWGAMNEIRFADYHLREAG
jgi:NinB protein